MGDGGKGLKKGSRNVLTQGFSPRYLVQRTSFPYRPLCPFYLHSSLSLVKVSAPVSHPSGDLSYVTDHEYGDPDFPHPLLLPFGKGLSQLDRPTLGPLFWVEVRGRREDRDSHEGYPFDLVLSLPFPREPISSRGPVPHLFLPLL